MTKCVPAIVAAVGIMVAGIPTFAGLAEDLQKHKDELDKQRSELGNKMNEIRAKIDKSDEIMALKKAAADAESASQAYVPNNAKLNDLRVERDRLSAEIRNVQYRVAEETAEGQAVLKEKDELSYKNTMLDFENRLADHIIREKVNRTVAQQSEIKALSDKIQALYNEKQDIRYGDAELQALEQEKNELRARKDEIYRENLPEALDPARAREKEASDAYRALYAEKTAETQKELDAARTAEAALKEAKTAADSEARKLNAELTDLREQLAEISFKISVAEFKLREGVARRINMDPDVKAAAAARSSIEYKIRAIYDSDPDIVELRNASDAARRAREAIEREYRESAIIAEANKAYYDKERAYQDLYNAKVADLDKQIRALDDEKRSLEEAARKADALGAEQYAKKDEVAAALNTNRTRWAELDVTLNQLRDAARESEAYIAAQQAANKAVEAFNEAYQASEGPALEKKRNDASSAVGKKLNELCEADTDYAAAKAKSDELYQKSRELDLEIRRAREREAAQDTEKN